MEKRFVFLICLEIINVDCQNSIIERIHQYKKCQLKFGLVFMDPN